MRKRLILTAIVFVLMQASSAYAHLTGAFADFLVTVYDESTTEKLKQEIAATKKEIAELTPRVQSLEEAYATNQKIAIEKLQFYNELGLDMWLTMLMQEQEVVDILGSQWLIEKNLDGFMNELDELYLAYKQLLTTRETLAGHQDLLAVIEENLQARKQFVADNPDLPLDQLANYLDIDWISEVEPQLMVELVLDRELTQKEGQQWAMSQNPNGPYRLTQAWLNDRSSLSYFFRSDHVYVVSHKPGLHVILIGQVLLSNDRTAAELVFEAGFFNGFLMPDTLIEELQGFRVPYEALRQLPGVSESFYIQQGNGELLLRSDS